MIYNCDDYEQLNKESQKIEQAVLEQESALSYDDKVLFSQLKKYLNQSQKEPEGYVPTQILNKYSQAPIVNQQEQNQTNIQKEEYLKESINNNESIISETQSLSLINDKYKEFNLIELQQWQKILSQYGQFFQDFKADLIVQTNRQLNYFFNFSKYAQQNQCYNNKVYLGLLIQTKEWIVVKEQELQNQSLIDAAQQFVIHNYIYKLYPNNFLKLWQPVFIQIDSNQKLKFISVNEQGLTDLYQYSQENLIKDLELSLIVQQIFQQIQLLHKHNIAHRDIKPQNIIYVENKGWVLCDFENSQKYNQAYGVYDIKGTFGFLQPEIQMKSRIPGMQIKQNLLKNDLYALAITLLVIKYQIKSQELIQQYLKLPQDPIIEVLLKSVSLEDLHIYIFKYEIRFIRPLLKQSAQSVENYIHKELVEFQITLGKLKQSQYLSKEGQTQLLNQIDELLKKKNRHDNYYHFVCYQELPQYVGQLKNIVKYKELRQRKYWNNVLYMLAQINKHSQILNQIKFMYLIGLTDLFLHFAQQYIQANYDFSLHIKIIDLLNLFQYYKTEEDQLNILLQYKEFYEMNLYEQQLFVNYSSKKCYKYMNNQDIDYCKQLGLKFKYTNDMKFLLDNISDEEFNKQIISHIEKIIKDERILITSRIMNIERLTVGVFVVKDIQISLKLLEILKQKQRFSCTTLDWQNIIKHQIQLNELLGLNNKNLTKNMNYVILFNSECICQQDILKFKKFSIKLYCNPKKKSFKSKIIHKIYLQIRNQSKCYRKFYSSAIMAELILIMIDANQKNIMNEFFFITSYVFKQDQLLGLLAPKDQERFVKLLIICYMDTKNTKRLQKLVPNDIFLFLLNRNKEQDNQIQIKNKQFLQNQYLCR